MSDQIMSIKEYAAKRDVSEAAVRRALIDGKKLVGVKFSQKIGRDWVLTVCNPVSKKNMGTCVVTHA